MQRGCSVARCVERTDQGAGGLFSPSAFVNGANGFFVNTGGPIYALEQVLNTITAALKAPAAAAAVKPVRADPASIPATTTAATITLKTGSSAVNIPAKPMSSTAVASPTGRPAGATQSASTTTDSTTKSDHAGATGSQQGSDTKPRQSSAKGSDTASPRAHSSK